jgi:raffinose/stachyose/melibiose transport system substrate-binding protein
MSIGKSIKTVLAGVLAVGCLASVAACGPGSSGSGANAKSEPVSTDLGSTKYELRLWDGAGLKKFDDQLIAAFQKKHPNITIKATYDPDNTSQQNGPRVISAADTPDIARVTDINSAVRGKHLVNLDPYAKAYGWKLPDAQTESYRVGSDGKIGSGSLYAVPDGVSMTGLYWNKKIAKQLGINEAPATVEELEADMKKATDAGVLAMMMPAKEGGTSYIYQALLTNYEGRDKVQDWIVQKDGATFKTPGAVKAAEKIKQWQDAHYFSSDALAFDGSTALSRFSDGKALFFPSGSWYSDSINTALGQDSGWVAYPVRRATPVPPRPTPSAPSASPPTPRTRTPPRRSSTSCRATQRVRSRSTTAIRRSARARPPRPTISCSARSSPPIRGWSSRATPPITSTTRPPASRPAPSSPASSR